MSKSIYFFGQSVFGQLISLIDKKDVRNATRKTSSDRFCKGFHTWDHLVTMLLSTLSNCSSLREVVAGCLGLKGKSDHIGLLKLPRRSTLSDANKIRTPKVFEQIYSDLLRKYRTSISDSRLRKMFGPLYIIDSTTISLFKDILKNVGRIPKSGKQKGGIKVHALLKADEQVPELIWYTKASANDVKFLEKITFKKDAVYVFDKGYVDYTQYEKIAQAQAFFVTRLKENAAWVSLEEFDIAEQTDSGVLKDEMIEIPVRKRNTGVILHTVKFRRIAYWHSESNRMFEYITNLVDLDPGQIALIFKQRWQIELLFKQLKQNFPLKYFLGDNVNAIVIQIWCTLISNLLLTVIKERLKRKWSFSNLVCFTRMHLFNYIHLIRFLNDPEKDWEAEIITEQNQLEFQ